MTKEKYWPNAWQKITDKLIEVDWKDFRSHKNSVLYIEGGLERGREFWRRQCTENKIPPKDYEDSLIGNPMEERQFKFGDVSATANSCRFAYYLHRISGELKSNKPLRVLELGGGYGGLAVQLCKKFSVSDYFFLDHPTLRVLQGYFMLKSGFMDVVSFDPPTDIDLIVSVGGTLSEMPLEAATKYIRLFESVLKPESGLLYMTQHKDKRAYILTAWDEYPFDNKWDLNVSTSVRGKMMECFGRRKK